MNLLPRPRESLAVEARFGAPPRLSAHHAIVHDVATRLLAKFRRRFPSCDFDDREILLGAATHDIGKAIITDELYMPGRRHEEIGPAMLMEFGFSASQARFARTHGRWRTEPVNKSDLIVALADTIWKGGRDAELEIRLALEISRNAGGDHWNIFCQLAPIIESVGQHAPLLLEYQRSFP